jgi:hypothetical protein
VTLITLRCSDLISVTTTVYFHCITTSIQFYYSTHEMDSVLTEEFGFQIPVRTRDFSSLPNVQTGSEAHPSSYSIGAGPNPEVSHPSVSSAGVKNEWSYNSNPPICFHGADRKCTLFF